MVVCEFSYSLVIQTVGVLGTLAIAALAIWGEQIRHRFAGPKLGLRLHDPEGGSQRGRTGLKSDIIICTSRTGRMRPLRG
jgi:hypothetical protein